MTALFKAGHKGHRLHLTSLEARAKKTAVSNLCLNVPALNLFAFNTISSSIRNILDSIGVVHWFSTSLSSKYPF